MSESSDHRTLTAMKSVKVDLAIIGETRTEWLIDHKGQTKRLPKLCVEGVAFDGPVPARRRVVATLPRWLAEERRLVPGRRRDG